MGSSGAKFRLPALLTGLHYRTPGISVNGKLTFDG
jgi:hypothetical protein